MIEFLKSAQKYGIEELIGKTNCERWLMADVVISDVVEITKNFEVVKHLSAYID